VDLEDLYYRIIGNTSTITPNILCWVLVTGEVNRKRGE